MLIKTASSAEKAKVQQEIAAYTKFKEEHNSKHREMLLSVAPQLSDVLADVHKLRETCVSVLWTPISVVPFLWSGWLVFLVGGSGIGIVYFI